MHKSQVENGIPSEYNEVKERHWLQQRALIVALSFGEEVLISSSTKGSEGWRCCCDIKEMMMLNGSCWIHAVNFTLSHFLAHFVDRNRARKHLTVKFRDEIVQNNGPIIMGCSGFVVVLPSGQEAGTGDLQQLPLVWVCQWNAAAVIV